MRDIRRRTATNLGDDLVIKEVPLTMIYESDKFRLRNPPYPGIAELAEDIRIRGQITPMSVMPADAAGYVLLAGCCRKQALELIGAKTAIVRVFHGLSDEEAYDLALSENQGRNSLTDLELAQACLRLQNEGKTFQQIAMRIGFGSEKTVSRYLRIAKDAPDPLREALQRRQISMKLASTFLEQALKLGLEEQKELLKTVIENDLSVAQFRRLAKRTSPKEPKPVPPRAPVRETKDGGFVLAQTRVVPESDSVEHAITVLQQALQRARAMKRQLDRTGGDSSAEPME
jgi:ParB/RepB/Spo0J family partition protein